MLVSVIVPVYNAERWLGRCVESVLGQTHGELELILVDDGSVDGSGALCDDYAVRDSRVRVIHKANGGVSAARNDGLEAARGEWIAFCDNDDFMAAGMVERLLGICVETGSDIAQCGTARGLAESLPMPPAGPVKVMTGRELLERFRSEGTIYIWDKIYRRGVWNGVRFPEGSYTGEDVWVVHHLFGAARTVAVTRERLYYHYRNPQSVMQRGFDVRWATGALDDREAFARAERLPRLLADTLAQKFYTEGYLLVMNARYGRDRAEKQEFAKEHRRLLRRNYRRAIFAQKIKFRDRVLMTVRLVVPPVFHVYNYLKFRILRGDRSVRYGEVK